MEQTRGLRTLTIIGNNGVFSLKFGSFYVTKLDDFFIIRNSENPHHCGFTYDLKYWDTFNDQLTNALADTTSTAVIDLTNVKKII